MSLNIDKNEAQVQRSNPKVLVNKQKSKKPAYNQSMDPDVLTEEEKQFEIQFKNWEDEFVKWKSQNVNHPDRKAYDEYEKKFEECRAKLLARREQMRQKKLDRIKQMEIKLEMAEEQDVDENEVIEVNTNDPNNANNDEEFPSNTLNVASIFQSNANSGIPGLDLMEGEGNFATDVDIKTEGTEAEEIDLTTDIQNIQPSTNIAESISKLIENPQVLTLLTLVGLTKNTPTKLQTNALKPITNALAKITGRNVIDIMDGLQKASIHRFNNIIGKV